MEVKLLLWFIIILVGLILFSLGLCKYILSLFSEMRKDYNKIIDLCEEENKLRKQIINNYEELTKNYKEQIDNYEKYFRKEGKEVY